MDQLTDEWQEGVLYCELREFTHYGLEEAILIGAFRVDEWLDVQQRVGDGGGSHKLCDILNVIDFKALPNFKALDMSNVYAAYGDRHGLFDAVVRAVETVSV